MFIKVTYAGKLMELLFKKILYVKEIKKVGLVDLNTNASLLFLSFNHLVWYFGLNLKTQGGNSPLRQCLIKKTLYNGCYKLYYLEDYKGSNFIHIDEN